MRSRHNLIGWLIVAALAAGCQGAGDVARPEEARPADLPAREAGSFRFSGSLEAVRSRTVTVPRLSGVPSLMIITTLAGAGTRVEEGDVVVRFDPQDQQRIAQEKRAELIDLDSQIDRKRADQAAADAKEQTGLVAARNDIARAKLAVSTNDLIARVEAEKNSLSLQQAEAKLAQLETVSQLKREAAAADLRILEIRRARAEQALQYAEQNATKMEIRAPFSGLVVVKTTWKAGREGQVEIMEGDEVRPGLPILDIVDTSAMQVRARVNQADAERVRPGQSATVRLDGFPELSFPGRLIQVTPLAVTGQSQTVRMFMATIAIDAQHPQLLPDLTASVEVAPTEPPDTPPASGGRP